MKKIGNEKDQNLLAMTQIYVKCHSIEEFLMQIDLVMPENVSRWKWTNPFVIYYVLSNTSAKIVFSIVFPLLIVSAGVFAMLLPATYSVLKLFCAFMQIGIMSLQWWIDGKYTNACQAITEVMFENICHNLSK